MPVIAEADIYLLRIKQMCQIIIERNKELLYLDGGYKDVSASSGSDTFNRQVLTLENELKKQIVNWERTIASFDNLPLFDLIDFDEKLTEVMLQLEIPIDVVEMTSELNQGGYIITSSAGSIVAVGRNVTYRLVEVSAHMSSADSKYEYRWYCENDVLTRGSYPESSSNISNVTERGGVSNWFDKVFGDPTDISLIARYPGIHDIKVDIILNSKLLTTAIFRQTVLEGDPEIIKLTFNEKLTIVFERCSFYDALAAEVGGAEGIIKLVGSIAVCAGVLAALAATGYGLAAEIIGGILAALVLGISITKVMHGLYKLVESINLTQMASSDAALSQAADIMDNAIAEIGVNAFFALMCYFGASKARTQVRSRIANGEKVFVRNTQNANNPVLENNQDIIKDPESLSQRPSWRASEEYVTEMNPTFREQISFKSQVEVPYGTKGSVRPDMYKSGTSLEVKNYLVETAAGRSRLVRNITNQVQARNINLPQGTKQKIIIDARGQNITLSTLRNVRQSILDIVGFEVEIVFLQ